MPDGQPREVGMLGRDVEFEVRRSTDASEPRIDVDIHGVSVIVPDDADLRPEKLLKESAAWVINKLEKYEAYRERIPERRFEKGEVFPYLDEPHEVVVERRPSSSVVDDTLRLAEHHVEETSVKRALETLYRRKAKEQFERRADHFASEMDLNYSEIQVRNQRTRFGSCSTSGTLGLNWRLMMAPPKIVDYVVIHELAHLREADHGDSFWSLVEEYDPNCQEHAKWLDQHSIELIFSKDDL
jgi:predicted metal-dependent hydrolase